MAGNDSLWDISMKYGLRSKTQLIKWIMKYNSHESLKPSGMGGNKIMTTGRKTAFDERVEIAKYCIEHQYDYNETAIKYEISYQRVYSWTKKYEEFVIKALHDKRGKRKKKEEISEI